MESDQAEAGRGSRSGPLRAPRRHPGLMPLAPKGPQWGLLGNGEGPRQGLGLLLGINSLPIGALPPGLGLRPAARSPGAPQGPPPHLSCPHSSLGLRESKCPAGPSGPTPGCPEAPLSTGPRGQGPEGTPPAQRVRPQRARLSPGQKPPGLARGGGGMALAEPAPPERPPPAPTGVPGSPHSGPEGPRGAPWPRQHRTPGVPPSSAPRLRRWDPSFPPHPRDPCARPQGPRGGAAPAAQAPAAQEPGALGWPAAGGRPGSQREGRALSPRGPPPGPGWEFCAVSRRVGPSGRRRAAVASPGRQRARTRGVGAAARLTRRCPRMPSGAQRSPALGAAKSGHLPTARAAPPRARGPPARARSSGDRGARARPLRGGCARAPRRCRAAAAAAARPAGSSGPKHFTIALQNC